MVRSPHVRRRRGPLETAAREAVLALAAQAERVDGVEALGEQTLLDLRDPDAAVVHLLVEDGGTAVGYAAVEVAPGRPNLTAELVVAPAHRRQGVGSALLAAVREEAAGVDARPAVWAHGHLPAARALAARAGLEVVRELWQMSVDLPQGTEGTVPAVPGEGPGARASGVPREVPGVVVRPFVVGQDEQAWLHVNARAFAHHPEQGRMTLKDLQAREEEPWFSAEDLLLAEVDGTVLASVWMKVEPGSDAGELYVLAVDPDAQGRGLGRLLTATTLDHLAAAGLRRCVLYTDATSTAAVRTYTSAGFRTSRVDVQYS